MITKKKVINLIILLLLLTGVALIVTPYINFFISNQKESYVIQDYNKSVNNADTKYQKKILEKAINYNSKLDYKINGDPFSSSQIQSDEDYSKQLKIKGSDSMGYVVIPKIDVMLPIYHGTSSDSLDRGVGHLEGTSLPVGGKNTHCVLTGHTGFPSAKLFTDLDQMQKKDIFFLKILDKIMAYKVIEIQVVEPSNISWAGIKEGEDLVTLLTCTPYGINSHRLIITGERTPYNGEKGDITSDILNTRNEKVLLLLLISVAIITTSIIIYYHRRHKSVS